MCVMHALMMVKLKRRRNMTAERISETQVHECLKIIIGHKGEKNLNLCVKYAQAGLCMEGETLRVQILYVLNNMICWRGDAAKHVRAILRRFVKENKNGRDKL